MNNSHDPVLRLRQAFGQEASLIAAASGRLEILGNHTDYNEGFVLSCAVEQRCQVAFAVAPGDKCLVWSEDLDEAIAFRLDQAGDFEPRRWGGYVRCVVDQLLRRGVKLKPFAAAIRSSVPLSAGMSSSAALEVALITGLLKLSGAELSPGDIARVGQAAESAATGARTGLMDQLTSCLGRPDQLVLSEYRGLSVRHVAMPAGYAWVVVDSGEKHDLSQEYNQRRAACERAAAVLAKLEAGVSTLRDVSPDTLERHAAAIGEDLPFARHVVEECDRVLRGEKLLLAGDVTAFGQLLFDSHLSSQNNFRNSCLGLDRLVGFARQDRRCLGARLSGGGFGGVSIHLVKASDAEAYAADITKAFTRDGKQPWHTIARIGGGPSVDELRIKS
ncbi:MAG: galactokinase [Verrucomicrobiota bacterium]|jgi:galactokinase